MTGSGTGVAAGAQAARSTALAVLRIRSRALAVALLPAAVGVVLLAGASTGHLVGPAWHVARWVVTPVAVLVLLAAGAIALIVARARPAVSPTVAIAEESAPDLYRMVRDLTDRLDVHQRTAVREPELAMVGVGDRVPEVHELVRRADVQLHALEDRGHVVAREPEGPLHPTGVDGAGAHPLLDGHLEHGGAPEATDHLGVTPAPVYGER